MPLGGSTPHERYPPICKSTASPCKGNRVEPELRSVRRQSGEFRIQILIGGHEMSRKWRSIDKSVGIITAVALGAIVLPSAPQGARSQPSTDDARADAIAVAQTSKEAPMERPEQKKTPHDLSDVFNPSNALPSSEALVDQQDRGQMLGFDFYRDPLGAMKPGMTFDDFYRAGVANKPAVTGT